MDPLREQFDEEDGSSEEEEEPPMKIKWTTKRQKVLARKKISAAKHRCPLCEAVCSSAVNLKEHLQHGHQIDMDEICRSYEEEVGGYREDVGEGRYREEIGEVKRDKRRRPLGKGGLGGEGEEEEETKPKVNYTKVTTKKATNSNTNSKGYKTSSDVYSCKLCHFKTFHIASMDRHVLSCRIISAQPGYSKQVNRLILLFSIFNGQPVIKYTLSL